MSDQLFQVWYTKKLGADHGKQTPEIGSLTTRERIEWINRHGDKVGSKKAAYKMMNISVSTYNYDPKITRVEKEETEADIREQIELVRVEFPRTGCRMFLHHLKRRGIVIGEAKLPRIIKKFNLQFKHKKKFIATTDSNHDCLVHPNLIQGIKIDNMNQVWTADITYFRIANGFIYLAVKRLMAN